MDYTPKIISPEGDVACSRMDAGFRPVLEAIRMQLLTMTDPERWEIVVDSYILDYVPMHSVILEVRCLRDCCRNAPREERHSFGLEVGTYFLDGPQPLTDVSLLRSGFSSEGQAALHQVKGGDPERLSPEDPRLFADVQSSVTELQALMGIADDMEEVHWTERE